jgi:signal recognition particle receptor subunit beta
MVQINFALKEVNCKIVYYGPGMSGKTTNLEVVHQKAPEENKGELTSISTDGDRTLFFDFMPLDLGNVAGMRTKFQLYTVPGQVYYNSTRKLVLQGVDGVIFIADSDPEKVQENIESYDNLVENLREYGKDIREVPHVIQYNTRDLPNAMSVEALDKAMNKFGVPTFEAVAATGEGVFPTLKVLAGMVLESIDRGSPSDKRQEAKRAAPARPAAQQGQGRAPAAAQAAAPAAPAQARGGAQKRPAPAAAAAAPAAAPAGRAAPPPPANRAPARPAAAVSVTRRMPPAKAAAQEPPKTARGGSGLVVSLVVVLLAAIAGAVYFVMQNPQ